MNSGEAEIRQIIESRADAVRKGNVEAMSADVADDVAIFDVVVPLRSLGKAASTARAAEWVGSYEGAIGWESRDVEVFADGDVAFSHSLSHVTGRLKTGAKVDMWFRTTLGLQRRSGHWLIVHEHSSSPFDPKSGQASLALKPQ
jgi:ketosteroid isomerase-like protein